MRASGARAGAAAEHTGGVEGGQGEERRGEGRKGDLRSSSVLGRTGMAISTMQQALLPTVKPGGAAPLLSQDLHVCFLQHGQL